MNTEIKKDDKVYFTNKKGEIFSGILDLIVKSDVNEVYDLGYVKMNKPTGKNPFTGEYSFYHKICLLSELKNTKNEIKKQIYSIEEKVQ